MINNNNIDIIIKQQQRQNNSNNNGINNNQVGKPYNNKCQEEIAKAAAQVKSTCMGFCFF